MLKNSPFGNANTLITRKINTIQQRPFQILSSEFTSSLEEKRRKSEMITNNRRLKLKDNKFLSNSY